MQAIRVIVASGEAVVDEPAPLGLIDDTSVLAKSNVVWLDIVVH
jgi:hypothetical protein